MIFTSDTEMLWKEYAKRGNNLSSFYREENKVRGVLKLKLSYVL